MGGETLWQSLNPVGTVDNCTDAAYDAYEDYAYRMVVGCERGPDGEPIRDPSETVPPGGVVRPPKPNVDSEEVDAVDARFVAPVTIAGDLVLVPSYSGHVFVLDLLDGHYVHTLRCPAGGSIQGGVTVVEERVIFMCGTDTLVTLQ